MGHLQSAIKDGYESDSNLVFKRRENHTTPRSQTPAEAKSAYTQIQKGGDIPLDGLRMSLPDKQRDNEEELILDDQSICPGSPQLEPKDSDEIVQLLVTADIENGGNISDDAEKTSEIEVVQATEAAEAAEAAEAILAVDEAVQNEEEKPEQ